MEYQELKSVIRDHLSSAAEDFFTVGYFLRKISENALFTEDGYESIWEFAKAEYGLSASSASRFMAINARFSIDGGEHMAEKYIGMGVSRLQEMLGLPDEDLEKVTQETTVREIRAMKKKQEEPLSFFGLPRTVRLGDSIIDTPGCGNGKYDCFSCAHPCGIRQEDRNCVTATPLDPFPCTQMDEKVRLDIGAGLYRDKCQHLHPDLWPTQEVDKELAPCCIACEYATCFSRCDIAKKNDRLKLKKEQEELEKQQKEAGNPEMTEQEMELLYGWLGIRLEDAVMADLLKERHGRSYHGGIYGGTCFHCSPRGVRSRSSREMTWAQVEKALRKIQAEKRGMAEPAVPTEDMAGHEKPDAVGTDFLEVGDSGKPEPGTAQERKGFHEGKAEQKAVKAEQNVIDADFQEVEGGSEPAGEEAEEAGPQEQDRERYSHTDVCALFDKYRMELADMRKADRECEVKFPQKLLRERQIIVDALELLYERMTKRGR